VSELPESWIAAALHEIVPDPQQDIVDGPFGSNLKANEYQDSGIPIIRLQNVARNRFLEKNIKFITHDKADELQRHNFVAGDIAITKLGDPLGKAAIIPPSLSRGVIVADIVRLRVDEEYADPRYLTYAINSPDVCDELAEKTKGTTRPRVNLGHIRSLQIPVAPLNEQKRIADKLDAVLARVDVCRERLGPCARHAQAYPPSCPCRCHLWQTHGGVARDTG
jgi:type I restriction enzyme S subunit